MAAAVPPADSVAAPSAAAPAPAPPAVPTDVIRGDDIERTTLYLRSIACGEDGTLTPTVGIVCGSGLSGLSQLLENPITVPYEHIPGFPSTTVHGHFGELVFGTLKGKRVVAARGRFHYYEGHSPAKVSIFARVFAALGCRVMIVTNAAGAVNPTFSVGDIAIISDHVYFPGIAGNHPLVGPNDERFGVRFPAVAPAFDADLGKIVLESAAALSITGVQPKAVYACVSGPSYETPAEIHFFRTIGVDNVGMSTVPEVIVGVHSGLRILGLSLITNKCLAPGDDFPKPTHEEVLAAVKARTPVIEALVSDVVGRMDTASMPETRAGYYFRNLKPAAAPAPAAGAAASKTPKTPKPAAFKLIPVAVVLAVVLARVFSK